MHASWSDFVEVFENCQVSFKSPCLHACDLSTNLTACMHPMHCCSYFNMSYID